MKKSEMKSLLKPIVEECVKEAILESGIVSQVVSEVLKGVMPMILEQKQQVPIVATSSPKEQADRIAKKPNITEGLKKELREIGGSSYTGLEKFNVGGVNVFEGTKPMKGEREPKVGDPLGGDPDDPGVDLSLLGNLFKKRG